MSLQTINTGYSRFFSIKSQQIKMCAFLFFYNMKKIRNNKFPNGYSGQQFLTKRNFTVL